MAVERPVLQVPDARAFHEWLDAHHASSSGVRLFMAKKGSGVSSPGYDEALEISLCYGWIDGQVKRVDDNAYTQVFCPRGKRSIWSVRNIGIVERLIADGRMQPSGQVEIDRAKADGRWDAAYHGPAKMEIPEDFVLAVNADPVLADRYARLKRMQRYHIYFELHNAKKPETRQRRFDKLIGYLRDDTFPDR